MMEQAIAQGLSSRVEAALKKVLAGADTDAFDAPDFDVYTYINSNYGSESALRSLSPTLRGLQEEIAALDESIFETIRVQSTAGRTAARDLDDAKGSINDLRDTIADITKRAQASEQLVQDICKDIRQLDTAQKHLSSSITALSQLQALTKAVSELAVYCARRDYEQAAPALEGCIALFSHLSEYRDVPKVSELATQVEKIREEMRFNVDNDFNVLLSCVTPTSLAFEESKSDGPVVRQLRLHHGQLAVEGDAASPDGEAPRELTESVIQTLRAAGEIIDALGAKDRRKIIKEFCNKQLRPYAAIFHRESEYGESLSYVDKRFSWFRRALREIEHRFGAVLPPHWAVPHRLCIEFCEMTRTDLEYILSRYEPASSVPADVLVRALVATQAFEKEMLKKIEAETRRAETAARHTGGFVEEEDEPRYDDTAPFYDDRGQLVDPSSAQGIKMKYMRGREMEHRKEEEKLRRVKRDEQRRWFQELTGRDSSAAPGSGIDEELAALPKIFEKGKGGLISTCFEPYMGAYIRFERQTIDNQVMTVFTTDFALNPDRSGVSTDTLMSASTLFSESRNILNRASRLGMPSIMLPLYKEIKEAFAAYLRALNSKVPKPVEVVPPPPAGTHETYDISDAAGPLVVEQLSLIVNTSVYCAETMTQLTEVVKKIVDEPNKDSIDFSDTADAFYDLQTSAIRAMAAVVAFLLETPLAGLSKTAWDKVAVVGDQSPYVADIDRTLRVLMSKIRCKRDEAPFRNFCDKFAKAFIARYSTDIFKIKKVSDIGAQQLLLDAQALRTLLLAAPTRSLERASSTGEDDEYVRPEGAPDIRELGLTTYSKLINRELPRVELLFKILAAPKENFVNTMRNLWPEAMEGEQQRVLDMKVLSKKDAQALAAELGLEKTGSSGISIGISGLNMGFGRTTSSTAVTAAGAGSQTQPSAPSTSGTKVFDKLIGAAKAAVTTKK